MSSWTTRRISQRVVSEDANRMVIEATAPSGTKGFFKIATTADANMVRVAGGILPQSSLFAGNEVADFRIAYTEVTWAEWQEVRSWAVANGYDLASVGQGVAPDHPVQNVNWYDVVKWCNARSEMEGLDPVYFVSGDVYRNGDFGDDATTVQAMPPANGYRLPTTTEWEWAARGGPSGLGYIYSGNNDLNAVGWFEDNSGNTTKTVGTKAGNELGVHDMSGNVWEWVLVPNEAVQRHRGGSFSAYASRCAITSIDLRGVNYARRIEIGFRVARNVE
jgi:formylglycine-generating enzyme required for sulfatase activity